MGFHSEGLFHDVFGGFVCLLGVIAQLYLVRHLRLRPWLRTLLVGIPLLVFLVFDEQILPRKSPLVPHNLRTALQEFTNFLYFASIGCAILLRLRNAVPPFRSERRQLLRVATAAVCATPAVALAAGLVTRKDFRISEVDLKFPELPKDLNGLRIVQISDLHVSTFFSADDLRRVVDATNSLRPDLTVITGDLITDEYDPLERCLYELRRLKSSSGVWGCLGNHDKYAGAERYATQKGRELGLHFLRHQAQVVQFGRSRLNLVGIDYQEPPYVLPGLEDLISPGDFNVLLSHTPALFPVAAQKGFDLTLSGHTHGGQINFEVLGTNLNLADLRTPYTKGEYSLPKARIYVNSGLGTIGVPVRLGAPAEISVIRLCSS